MLEPLQPFYPKKGETREAQRSGSDPDMARMLTRLILSLIRFLVR